MENNYCKSEAMNRFNTNTSIFFISILLFCITIFQSSADARYASIVIDERTGKVLHASNPDRQRYPASLTKMMTLYMVFDALDRGKLKLNQRLRVSRRAQGMAPSKLGLKRGQSITVKDAILALITKSANDVAVVVAESLGKTEINFAKMMTRKARSLGMRKTRFRNASGLPNRRQVSTARDMATLARKLITDFPQFYHLFKTQRFSYKRRTYRNHNRLLRAYPGVDGIKTGYIRASGFNLVASTKRYGRRLIGVVFGGKSAQSRDRHMRKLFERAYALVPKKKKRFASNTAKDFNKIAKPRTRIAKANYTQKFKSNQNRIRRWAIQVGAFSQSSSARLAAYGAAGRLQGRGVAEHGRVAVVMHKQARNRLYRAQIVGMSQRDAMKSCTYLRAQQQACVAIPPILQ
jgi:D-alanyl-D-alanine carboxypeptidase